MQQIKGKANPKINTTLLSQSNPYLCIPNFEYKEYNLNSLQDAIPHMENSLAFQLLPSADCVTKQGVYGKDEFKSCSFPNSFSYPAGYILPKTSTLELFK